MKKILLLLSLFLFTSCYLVIRYPLSVPKKIRALYTQCYSIDKLDNIPYRIDGYYNRACNDDDCLGGSFMFYKDGTVAEGVALLDTCKEGEYRINKKYLYNQARPWGTYTISNDTIIVQVIHNVHNSQTIHHYTFKVIDRYKLQLISDYGSRFDSDTLSLTNEFEMAEGNLNILYEFYPLEYKPNNTHFWLKKKKWFWCDEQEYKEYMRKLKRSREVWNSTPLKNL